MNKSSSLAYCLSLFIVMILNIAPWPPSIAIAAPDWVLLTLIYWGLITPETASVGKAWIVGLLVDALTGQLLGQYALAYAGSIYLCVKQHKRIKYFPILQQGLAVCIILFTAQLLVFLVEQFNHQEIPTSFWLPVLTGGLIWPVIYLSLSKVRLL